VFQGWLEAYVLTGRHGLFVSYEAFVRIATMASLHGKWLKMAHDIEWRPDVASLNYVLSSHVWRQDQDGYSHQGPGFIGTLLDAKRTTVRIYHACDANVLLVCAERALRAQQDQRDHRGQASSAAMADHRRSARTAGQRRAALGVGKR
jgi:xylulose-5-phosphate/fructose-6-phosphate phosphoketolase